MKSPLYQLLLAAFAGLFLAGCSTPADVKNLAQQTRLYDSRMGETHQQDLRNLAEYDRQRVVQFNRLLNDYLSLRVQVLNAFNESLAKAKQSALVELDHEFDQQAEFIMTSLFWTDFRKEADGDLNRYILTTDDRSFVKGAQANAYPTDPEPKNQALLAARQRYLAAAIAYETVESSFAEMVIKINAARTEYHTANEALFASIKPLTLPDLPAGVTNFTLPDNTAIISQRISDLKDAYKKLDDAHGETVRYLNENNPGGSFILAVAGGTLGVDLSGLLNKTSVPTNPTDPAAAQPSNLTDILGQLAGKISDIQTVQSTGKSNLAAVIKSLVQNIKPAVKVISAPAASGANSTASTIQSQN